MFESQSEMFKAGYNDYVNNNDCNFPTDLDYMEGWETASDMMWELEMESELEKYENEHMYFEV